MQVELAKQKIDKYLIDSMDPQGWWPYKVDRGPSLEATSWSAFALSGNTEIAETTSQYLVENQNKDGGWSTAPNTGFSDWVTGPCLMALNQLMAVTKTGESRKIQRVKRQALLHLVDNRPVFYPVVGRLLLFLSKGPEGVEYDRGWPWDPDCYHWVEPTSYNLIALKISGLHKKDVYNTVCKVANKYLLKNVCKHGGWNYGNRKTLGAYLTPFRVTTAEALLALQDIDWSKKAIKESIVKLKSYREKDTSVLGLAWSILCLDAYKQDYSQELEFLLNRQKEDGSFTDNNMANALSSLALSCKTGANPLKLDI